MNPARTSLASDTDIRRILSEAKTIAVVGASQKPWRDSHTIMEYLIDCGYAVIPVNPSYDTVLGRQCFRSLLDVPKPIDIVDVFRKATEILPIVDDALAVGALTFWMQTDVINEEAARRALRAGMNVVMNRCIAVEHRLLVRTP